MRISNFTFINSMIKMASFQPHFFFCVCKAFIFLYKITIQIIFINCSPFISNNIAICQIISLCTKFKILRPVVCLNFIFMVNNKTWLVAFNKMNSYKPMYLIMCCITISIK